MEWSEGERIQLHEYKDVDERVKFLQKCVDDKLFGDYGDVNIQSDYLTKFLNEDDSEY